MDGFFSDGSTHEGAVLLAPGLLILYLMTHGNEMTGTAWSTLLSNRPLGLYTA